MGVYAVFVELGFLYSLLGSVVFFFRVWVFLFEVGCERGVRWSILFGKGALILV